MKNTYDTCTRYVVLPTEGMGLISQVFGTEEVNKHISFPREGTVQHSISLMLDYTRTLGIRRFK